jgi:hypothetical protein
MPSAPAPSTTAAFAFRASAIAWSFDWRDAQPPDTSEPDRVASALARVCSACAWEMAAWATSMVACC